jgi:hypothetical protein
MDYRRLIALLVETGLRADESVIAADMINRLRGSIPDRQLIEEVGLAIAIHRRRRT